MPIASIAAITGGGGGAAAVIIEIFWSMSNVGWSALISDIYKPEERSTIQGQLMSIGAINFENQLRIPADVFDLRGFRAWAHSAPAATANHWLNEGLKGRPRGIDSRRRLRLMNGLCRTRSDGFDWLVAPVLKGKKVLARRHGK